MGTLSSVNPSSTRYAPTRAFPRYAYLPGRDPHPTRSPDGHSYAPEPGPASVYLPAAEWRANEEYLFGIDLYNHGYLWEAHEAWEGLWHKAKQDSSQAEHLQGLIQCAAASLKVRMEQPRGLEKLAVQGLARLERVVDREGPHYMGLDLPAFVAAFRAFASSSPEDDEQRPRLVLALAE